jgi:hypothetical protein
MVSGIYVEIANQQILIDLKDYEMVTSRRWHKDGYGYVKTVIDGKAVALHKIINQTPDGFITDHINGKKWDNRRSNLRSVTHQQNAWNRGANPSNGTGLIGVAKSKKGYRFRANIRVDGKNIKLGSYKHPIDAAIAYNEAAVKYRGQYARLNNIDELKAQEALREKPRKPREKCLSTSI